MTDERRQRILAIADELESQGLTATNSAVYARALGHRGHVVQTLKQRRAAQAALGGVAVVEAEAEEQEAEAEAETETPAVVLAEDLRQLLGAYESWHAALEQIWALEKDGPLDLHTFSRARWLEYQLTENLKQQERLRLALEQARLKEAVRAAQVAHDDPMPEASQKAEAFLQALATVAHLGLNIAKLSYAATC